MAIGRISGAMLKANLERLGTDIAFETDLLYIDVVNDRIGINTNSPTKSLQVDNITLEGRSIRAVGGDLDLGAVEDITITGGSASQVLRTDGSGNLSWVSVGGGGLVTGRDVTLSYPDDSSLYPTGAIRDWADTTNVSTAIDDLNELTNNIINNTAVANVDFTADVTTGGAGLVVTLTITADGNPTHYDIDWGTGETATTNTTDSTPSHTYNSNTNSPFTVTVTAKNNSGSGTGSTNTKTRAGYIILFTATPVTGFAAYLAPSGGSPVTQWDDGTTVYFENTTTNTSGATVQYTWDWGDSESDDVISSDSSAGGSGGARLAHTFTASTEQEQTRVVRLTLDSHSTALPSDTPTSNTTSNKIYDTHTPTVALSSTSGINEVGTSGHPVTFTNNTENTIGSYSTYGIRYKYTWGDGQTQFVNTGSNQAGDTGRTINHTYTLSGSDQSSGTPADYTGKLEVLSDHSSSPFSSSNFTVHVEPDMRASATGTAITTSDASGDNQYDIYDFTDIDGTNRALVTVTNATSPVVSSPAASYTFNWADGSSNDTPTEDGSSPGTVGNAITHNYAGKSAGNYNLNLSVNATPDITAQSDSYTGITFQLNSVPSAPANLSTKSLTLNDSYQGSSPKLCHGFTDNTSSFTSQSPGDSLSTSTSRRYTSTTTIDTNTVSNFITNHYNGTNQTLTSKINNVSKGARTFTTSEGGSNNTTDDTLVITNHRDYDQVVSSYPQRAYLVATAKITEALSDYSIGSSAQRLESSGGGNTNVVHVVKDDMTSSPTTAIGTIAEGSAGSKRYISGIPYYNTGSPTVTITGSTVANFTGQAYRDTSSPVEVDPGSNQEGTSGSIISNLNFTYANVDGSTTMLDSGIPKVNTGVGSPYTLGVLTVPLLSTQRRSVQQIKMRASNCNGTSSYSTASTKIQLYTNSLLTIDNEAGIPVADSLGNGSTHTDDGVRITGFGTASDTPSFTGSTNYYTSNAWSGAVTVAGTQEAVCRFGTLQHYTTDLSSGYLPVGPDLDTGRSGAQYFTFAFRRTPAANFKFKFSGKLSGVWIAAPGSAIDSASGLNGWIDATDTYAGSGVPGSNTGAGGNGSNGCANTPGDRVTTGSTVSNESSTLTLGSENMANTTGNTILVRIKLVSGDSITALEIEDA